ncbi:hypothetical protein BB561_003133 [Smittium simulii]|uniref:Dilute domain-containing protein n=1 Tax=Smittium simulii TaxID=133385 RepID=A0A2T9YMS6_9FUNG|nr:hypothetical protein BB561_003133 [Smittium simulii]
MLFKLNPQNSKRIDSQSTQVNTDLPFPISSSKTTLTLKRSGKQSQNPSPTNSDSATDPKSTLIHTNLANMVLDEDFYIVGDNSLSLEQKKLKLNQIFVKAAIENDLERLQSLWSKWSPAGWLDIDFKDEDSITSLIHASFSGNYEAVKFILECGAKVNLANSSGWTALMWAVNNDCENIVKILLENGASLDAKSLKGYTAMSIASVHRPLEKINSTKESSNSPDNVNFSLSVDSSFSDYSNNTLENKIDSSLDKTHFSNIQSIKKVNRHSKVFELLQGSNLRNSSSTNIQSLDPTLAPLHTKNINSSFSPLSSPLKNAFAEPLDQDHIPDFNWDTVLPNQMYVVPVNGLGKFLLDLVSNFESSIATTIKKNSNFDFASLIFFAVRFISTLEDDTLLDEFLQQIVATFISAASRSKDNIDYLAYYYSNTQILYYFLLREPNLSSKTDLARDRLSSILVSIYFMFSEALRDVLEKYIDEGLLDYAKDSSLFENVVFEKEQTQSSIFQLFRAKNSESQSQSPVGVSGRPLQRSMSTRMPRQKPSNSTVESPSKKASLNSDSSNANRRSLFFGKIGTSNDPTNFNKSHFGFKSSIDNLNLKRSGFYNSITLDSTSEQSTQFTPTFVIHTITKYANILMENYIYPSLISSFVLQSLYYISAEMFNRVLTTKEFCCRSRALQIRMNLTVLEDWLGSTNFLKTNTIKHKIFSPLIELLQMLQVLTSLSDLSSFVETIQCFNYLNILHLDTIIKNYRYEIGEKKICPQIICYVQPSAKKIKELQIDQKKDNSLKHASLFDFGEVKDKLSYYDSLNNNSSFDYPNKNSYSESASITSQSFNNSSDLSHYNRPHGQNSINNSLNSTTNYHSIFGVKISSDVSSNHRAYDRYEGPSSAIKSRARHQISLAEILTFDSKTKSNAQSQTTSNSRNSTENSNSINSASDYDTGELKIQHEAPKISRYNAKNAQSSNLVLSSFLDNLAVDPADDVLSLKNSYDLFDSSFIEIPEFPNITSQLIYWKNIRTKPNLPIIVNIKKGYNSSREMLNTPISSQEGNKPEVSDSAKSDGVSATSTPKANLISPDNNLLPTKPSIADDIYSNIDLIPLLPNMISSEF